jgi:hypothetical protein
VRSLLCPRAMLPVERPPPLMELQGTPVWSNTHPSSSNSSFKRRLISSRRSSKILKIGNWLLPLHQMKRPMFHLKTKTRARKGDKKSYNTTSFNYDHLPPSSAFTSVPLVKAPHFDATDYTKWRYSMKMHLISLNLSIWTIVRTGVEFLDEDEEPNFEQLQ